MIFKKKRGLLLNNENEKRSNVKRAKPKKKQQKNKKKPKTKQQRNAHLVSEESESQQPGGLPMKEKPE